MKKKNYTKKELKRIKKKQDSDFNNKKKKREPDLWKEIRSNLKPLSKAYNKFREKRKILKQNLLLLFGLLNLIFSTKKLFVPS